MADAWYEAVPGNAGILQGDLIPSCPLLVWKENPEIAQGGTEQEEVSGQFEVVVADVCVMTQACDLEQGKVSDVVVCTAYTLAEAREAWFKKQGPGTGENAWKRQFERLISGSLWNFSVLNRGKVGDLETPHRVVDFHDIATIPLSYLRVIAERRGPRLRLRPPYREHLSQSFARYFMRVGLPVPVESPFAHA